jgi:hypothetical protein
MDSKTARIRALNDELRQNLAEGIAVMTPGIAALGAEAVARALDTTRWSAFVCRERCSERSPGWPTRSAPTNQRLFARY